MFAHSSCEINHVLHLFYSLLFHKGKGQLFLMLAVVSLCPVGKTEYKDSDYPDAHLSSIHAGVKLNVCPSQHKTLFLPV